MLSTTSILENLKSNYPQLSFKKAERFYWSSCDNTIYYDPTSPNIHAFLLHELAHALLEHTDYRQDIELLIMERQAWDYAKNLAKNYDISIPENIVQETIDSYRDWMHARSICPSCQSNGLQSSSGHYICGVCNNKWQPNEARNCSLRRYKIKNA